MTASTLSLPTDVHGRGLLASRPAAGFAGREYFATDGSGTSYRDNGTSWDAQSSGGALTVREADGTPSDAAITELVFPNGSLVIAAHVATISEGFPLGLTGATAATRYVGGTSSGAPTTGTFVVGDFVVDQVGRLWVCTTAGSPGTWTVGAAVDYDKSPVPTVDDVEFKATTDNAGFTVLGSLDSNDSNTDLRSNLHLRKTATGTFQVHGLYKAIPSMPFTVTARLSDLLLDADFQQYGLMVGEAAPGKLLLFGPTYQSSNGIPEYVRGLWASRTSRTSAAEAHPTKEPSLPWRYIRLVVTSSTDVVCYHSRDGRIWQTTFATTNPAFTIGMVGLFVTGNDNSTAAEAYFDWIRFGTNVVQPEAILWQNVGGGGTVSGALVGPLETHVAASSATLDFTTFANPSLYDDYVIRIRNLSPATNIAELMLRVSLDGGATYEATNYYGRNFYTYSGGTGISGATSTVDFRVADSISNTAGKGMAGEIWLFGLHKSHYKKIRGRVLFSHGSLSDDVVTEDYLGEWRSSSTAINALRLLMSTGNIAEGIVSVYGLAK